MLVRRRPLPIERWLWMPLKRKDCVLVVGRSIIGLWDHWQVRVAPVTGTWLAGVEVNGSNSLAATAVGADNDVETASSEVLSCTLDNYISAPCRHLVSLHVFSLLFALTLNLRFNRSLCSHFRLFCLTAYPCAVSYTHLTLPTILRV